MYGSWTNLIFETIDLRSFSNLWFWIGLAVMWSVLGCRVLGAPVDLLSRARRQGGQAQLDLEALVHIHARRQIEIMAVAGVWLVAIGSFILAGLATLAVVYGREFAQALVLLVLPLCLIRLMSLRVAQRIVALDERGPTLDRRLMQHRIAVQLVGMISILVTSLYGMWVNLMLGALR
jgi:hypothetical protein